MSDPVAKVTCLAKKEVSVLKTGGDDYVFDKSVQALEMSIEWFSLKGSFSDLDVILYLYDDNARFIEKLNFDKPLSKDGGFELLADLDNTKESKSHEEQVHINFNNIASSTSSAIVFIDGGPRNFQCVSNITARVTRKFIQNDGASNFSASLDNIASDEEMTLFESSCVPRKDYQAVLALVLHKTGFHANGSVAWSCKAVFEPVMVSRSKEKDDVCDKAIVNLVPLLHQYRPHLFPSVQAICAELSSTALPNLKRIFMEDSSGLPIDMFTEVIFMQLYEVNNNLSILSEAEYTVAMLHELFGQIDYNGDGFVDWDEFTTFCIYTGLITETSKPPTDGSAGGLDNYVIEYTDDKNLKDNVHVSFAPLVLMRHVVTTKKIIVLADSRDVVNIMNERLGLYAKINPKKFIESDCDKADVAKLKVLDVVYIPFKDLYCYSTSDHSIVFCKELQGHAGKKHVTFNIYNIINHTFLHVKLCWSDASKILCSVNVDNTIFGWEVDSTVPLFQISRHSQKITDFISLDEYGLFATCSLDKRIKLWSQTTRRMKGVLVGHKRGIRFLSYAKDCLLSAGFECEAKAWDLDLFEQTLTLRGHRHSISACKVMWRVDQEDELRGLTVDESGEFRLWDLFAKKGSDCGYATTLQTFNSKDNDSISRVNFLAIPYDKEYSNGEYSNVIAGTYALMHFRPEKSVQEFVPPACMIYSETNCCLLSACGRNLLKYDIITGTYQNSFPNIGNSDISCLCMDGTLGRRVFVGFSNGNIYMINFATGQILSTIQAHATAVSCLCLMKSSIGSEDVLYAGSNDGTIRLITETSGELGINSTLEHAMGDHSALATIIALEHAGVIVATSIARCWGVWHKQSLKRAFLMQEEEPISGVAILGGGNRTSTSVVDFTSAFEEATRKIITLAVCVSECVRIYTLNLDDLRDVRGCASHRLRATGVYFTNIVRMTYPQSTSLNYKVTNQKTILKDVLVAATDTGKLLVWNINNVLAESVNTFHFQNPEIIDNLTVNFADSIPEGFSMPVNNSSLSNFESAATNELEVIQERDDLNNEDEEDGDEGEDNEEDEDSRGNDNDNGNDNDSQSEFSVGSEDSGHSLSSLFSLTSAMGTVENSVKPDLNRASSIGMRSLKVAKTTVVVDSSNGPSNSANKYDTIASTAIAAAATAAAAATLKGLEEMRKLRRQSTVNITVSNNSKVAMRNKNLICINPVSMWCAHDDSIITLQILGDSGCFASISLDGFHRVWNLQKDCLGMLALPNLTDEMKLKSNENQIEWLFLKEKIPVKAVHTSCAMRFLEAIAAKNLPLNDDEEIDENLSNTDDIANGSQRKCPVFISTNDEGRNNILMSLLGSYRDAPSSVLPAVSIASSKSTSSIEKLSKSGGDIATSGDRLPLLVGKNKRRNNMNGLKKVSQEIDDLKHKLDQRFLSPVRANQGSTSSSATNAATHTSLMKKKRASSSTLMQSSNSSSSSTVSAMTMKSMFASDKEWNDPNSFVRHPVNAFSASSIDDGYKDGLLDEESHRILRILNKDEFRTKAFDRVVPGVMLRNVAMSTSFKFPTSQVNHAEMSFGHQRDMYKNANHIINDKNKISSVSSQMNARHGLAMKRLKQNVTKVGPMTQQSECTLNVDISLPSISLQDDDDEDEDDKGKKKEKNDAQVKSTTRTSSRGKHTTTDQTVVSGEILRKPNAEKLEMALKKVKDAEVDSIPDWELALIRKRDQQMKSSIRRRRNDKCKHSQRTTITLEGKLAMAIKRVHAADETDEIDATSGQKRPILRARDLVPHYKLSDVKNFLDGFFRVDKNMSGMLDLEEWVEFFLSMNDSMTAHSARQLFSHIDSNGDGVLTLHELVPVIFSQGTTSQVSLILKYVDDEISRNMTSNQKHAVLKEDLAILFEAYDADNIGYIKLQLVRDKLVKFHLPVAAQIAFNSKLKGMEDDDMVNFPEFSRMFVPYTTFRADDGEHEA